MKAFYYLLPLAFLISSCASGPNQIVVAPDFIQPSSSVTNINTLSLDVSDIRTSKHLVQIRKKDQAANLFNSQKALSEVINNTLLNVLQDKGIKLNHNATSKVNVVIEQALISVEQSTLKYSTTSNLRLSVTAINTTGSVTKSYHQKGTGEGPLKADMAVLGRDFNQALTQLLNQILNDQDLLQHLQQ